MLISFTYKKKIILFRLYIFQYSLKVHMHDFNKKTGCFFDTSIIAFKKVEERVSPSILNLSSVFYLISSMEIRKCVRNKDEFLLQKKISIAGQCLSLLETYTLS